MAVCLRTEVLHYTKWEGRLVFVVDTPLRVTEHVKNVRERIISWHCEGKKLGMWGPIEHGSLHAMEQMLSCEGRKIWFTCHDMSGKTTNLPCRD
jgi:hypothetical protein